MVFRFKFKWRTTVATAAAMLGGGAVGGVVTAQVMGDPTIGGVIGLIAGAVASYVGMELIMYWRRPH